MNNKKYKIILFLLLLLLLAFVYYFFIYSVNVNELKKSVVKIYSYNSDNEVQSTGSGFCMFYENLIVTNFHVVEGAKNIKIESDEGEYFEITSVDIFSVDNDLAILRGNFNLKTLSVGDSKNIKIGSEVIAIGSPQGYKNTVSTGIVGRVDENGIQITAPLSPGSSGGALFSSRGKVIGVNYLSREDAQNLNFAIEIEKVEELYKDYMEGNYIKIVSYLQFVENLRNRSGQSNNASFGEMKVPNELVPDISENDTLEQLVITGNKSYSVSDLKTFYESTNKYMIFDNAMNKWEGGMFDSYHKMNINKKHRVADWFEALEKYEKAESIDSNINSISEWNAYEWFLELNIMPRCSLAVVLTVLEDTDKSKYFKTVDSFALDIPEKIMLLLMICDYGFENLHSKDKERLFDYIGDLEIGIDDSIKILRNIGYRVKKTSSTTYTGYW